jgi:hypothetical protein
VLVGEGLELLLLDETALGGLLEQTLGGRKVMQMYRLAQWNPFLSGRAEYVLGLWLALVRGRTREFPGGPLSVVIERAGGPVHS